MPPKYDQLTASESNRPQSNGKKHQGRKGGEKDMSTTTLEQNQGAKACIDILAHHPFARMGGEAAGKTEEDNLIR